MTTSRDFIKAQIDAQAVAFAAPFEDPAPEYEGPEEEENDQDEPEEVQAAEQAAGSAAPPTAREIVADVLSQNPAEFAAEYEMDQLSYLRWATTCTRREWEEVAGPGAEPIREWDLPDDLRAMLMRESLSERISEGARRHGWTTETLNRGRR